MQVSALTTPLAAGRAAWPRKEIDADCLGSGGTQTRRQSVLKNLPFKAEFLGKLKSSAPTSLQVVIHIDDLHPDPARLPLHRGFRLGVGVFNAATLFTVGLL